MTTKKNFPVIGMGCAACVARVEKAIKGVNGVKNCSVSLASNSAQVDYDPAVTGPKEISKAVSDAGYELISGDDEEDSDRRKGRRDLPTTKEKPARTGQTTRKRAQRGSQGRSATGSGRR